MMLLALAGCAPGGEAVAPIPITASGADIGLDAAECRSTPDSDLDSLADHCELALAEAFAPLLVADSTDCRWDSERRRIGGGYYHAARPTDDTRVRIVYMPAYYVDCGLAGLKCLIPGLRCRPHAGDSELIAVDAAYSDVLGRWLTEAVFLSAHCFDGGNDDCRWFGGEQELEFFAWRDGRLSAPVVWVADGRHANYPTRANCDRGHRFTDSCDGPRVAYSFPVARDRNVGSATRPIAGTGCVDAAHGGLPGSDPDPENVECFWTDRPFRGWQGVAFQGVTPYRRYLLEVVGFADRPVTGVASGPGSGPGVDRLTWLAGCWEQRTGDRLLEEQWMAPRAGTLLGMSRLVRGERTLSYESMRIFERDDAIVYAAAPAGQPPAEFTSTHVVDSVAVFENAAHDFPQRIAYRHAPGDSLHARIEGLQDGEMRAADFRMGRVACPG